MSSALLDAAVLWVHLLSAALLAGGSFFMWLVVVPASRQFSDDEGERMRIIERIARRFGTVTNIALAVLVLTGIYNASWYLPSSALLDTRTGNLLLAKSVLVVGLVLLVYVRGFHFGRKIVRLAGERKLQELEAVRKRSRVVSATNLALMVAILVLAVLLQIPA